MLSLLAAPTNRLEDLIPLVPGLVQACTSVVSGEVEVVPRSRGSDEEEEDPDGDIRQHGASGPGRYGRPSAQPAATRLLVRYGRGTLKVRSL